MAYGAFIVGGGGGTIPRIGDAIVTTVKTSPAARYKNTTWELVAQNRVPMGAGDGHKGGETVEAGLPNIEGSFALIGQNGAFIKSGYATGCFELGSSTNVCVPQGQTETNTGSTVFRASRSNSIYGASDTVQPPAYYFYFWRRVS